MIRRNWLNFWLGLVAVALISPVTRAATTYTKECDPNDPDKCSIPLIEGEAAPFSGQLLTTKMAIVLGQKAEAGDIRLKIETDRLKEEHKLQLEYEKKTHQIDNDANAKSISVLQKELANALVVPWYKHPAFIVSCTVVGTVLVFFATAEMLKNLP